MKFDHDKLAAAELAAMVEPDETDTAADDAPEAEDEATPVAEDGATPGAEDGATAGAEDETTPGAEDEAIIEVSMTERMQMKPKPKGRPAGATASSAEPPAKKAKAAPQATHKQAKVKALEPTQPADPPSNYEEDREGAVSDFMCEKLSKEFGCDSMSIIALRLLADASSKGAKEANSIIWNLMRKINSLNSPSAFVSACVVNARRELGLDERADSWSSDWEDNDWNSRSGWNSRGWNSNKW